MKKIIAKIIGLLKCKSDSTHLQILIYCVFSTSEKLCYIEGFAHVVKFMSNHQLQNVASNIDSCHFQKQTIPFMHILLEADYFFSQLFKAN